jgi:predicted DNA-binding transcriptional regulator YafY
MNRTDRLLAIVLELQRAGMRRAEDLARTFETSVRTIYRDMEALSEAGVPLIAEPGKGYALMEGYFLPPLTFRADEATMLLLGSDVVGRQFDAQYRAAAQSAAAKIEAVLPDRLMEDVRAVQESIRFITPGTPVEGEALQMLRRTILDRRTVRFRYTARNPSEARPPREREVDPYLLAQAGGVWLLIGFDHLRRDTRSFRLNRMDDLTITAQTFDRPERLALGPRTEDRTLTVRVLFATEIARWVQETRSFFTVAEEETPDGLLVTLMVRDDRDVLQWLLGWGRHVRILEPDSLRQRVADEGAAIASNNSASLSLLT